MHRISEGGFDPELIKAWDYEGWKYSFMSSLAVAGSVMPTILPYETDLVPRYVEFYQKWLRWAKDNFDYVNATEPFGEQVQPGAVDGYARIKDGHGFIFLFNGNPRSSEITFEVGDEINLQARGHYQFTELYPSEKGRRVLDNDGKSIFALGQTARVTVPANTCYLLELKKVSQEDAPPLLGAEGTIRQQGDSLEIAGISGKPGQRLPMRAYIQLKFREARDGERRPAKVFRISGRSQLRGAIFRGTLCPRIGLMDASRWPALRLPESRSCESAHAHDDFQTQQRRASDAGEGETKELR